MTLLILGLAVFLATHFFTACFRSARDTLIGNLGAGAYRGLFSVVAIIGFVLIIIGWRSADASVLYAPPSFLRHITHLLMLPAIILLVAAYAPAGKIAHAVQHPMLAGVKLWSFAHLLSNGEVRSVLLFGGFLAFAVIDRIAVKRRAAPIRDAGPASNDVIVVVAGIAVYGLVFFYLHRYIAGVPVF